MWLRNVLAALIFTALCINAHAARLVWDANTEPHLRGYKIHYGSTSGQYTETVDVGNVTEWQIPDEWPRDRTYYFAATAYAECVDAQGQPYTCESGYSNEAVYYAEATPPSPATDVRVEWTQIKEQSLTTLGPLSASDDGYEYNADGGASYEEDYSGDVYSGYYSPHGAEEHACFSFLIPAGGAVPSGATITKAYFRARCTYSDASVYIGVRVENACPATAWGSAHRPSAHVSWVDARTPTARTLSTNTWYFGESDTYATDLTDDFQTLLSTGSGFEVGDRINICLYGPTSGSTAEAGWYAEETGTTYLAQLTIEYTSGPVPVFRGNRGMMVGMSNGMWFESDWLKPTGGN